MICRGITFSFDIFCMEDVETEPVTISGLQMTQSEEGYNDAFDRGWGSGGIGGPKFPFSRRVVSSLLKGVGK